MPDVRTPAASSPYFLPKHEFLTVYHYALQYNEWREKYKELSDGQKSHEMDGQPKKKGPSNPTQSVAVELASLAEKMRLVEQTVHEIAPEIERWLLAGVTNEKTSYKYLRMMMGIPCGPDYYYERRRKFYFELARRMS